MTTQTHILVIKLGALGDFIQALGPMAAIRKHHPDSEITMLTTAPFESLARDCGYFDEIWIDEKPAPWNLIKWIKLRKRFNSGTFSRVYDLQNSDRTSLYFKLLSPKPEWVGVAKGCSHRNSSPTRTAGHAFDGHVQTLALAGIKNIEVDQLDWMTADTAEHGAKLPFALLVPGSAPQHLYKRWPAQSYAALAAALNTQGVQPIILGTKDEASAAQEIKTHCPKALDLTGKTSLAQIVTLAKTAKLAIGNDTGPMHLIGATGCPSLVLFSAHSAPTRHQPKGEAVQFLQKESISDLTIEEVLKNLKERALID